ncbi:MAG: sensor histidine kinase [Candidatus Villigracilaceae bacterium]
MSLRGRLTLLYTTLLGGILLLLGVGVYALVNYSLIKQVDKVLSETAARIIKDTYLNANGKIDIPFASTFNLTSGIYVQSLDHYGSVISRIPPTLNLRLTLDPKVLQDQQVHYQSIDVEGKHLRVLSVPLVSMGRTVGVLQLATSLKLADTARQDLLYVLVSSTFLAMLIAGFASWLAIGQALAPLATVTQVAEQINRAADLARRIPYRGPENDEIGQLIAAFNQTLERLEALLSSQQRFLTDVSHELRTPLTVIKGNVDLIRRMKTIDEESLSSIEQEAGRLKRLVEDLLTLAKAESGTLELRLQTVELDTLLLEVVKEMSILAAGRVKVRVTEIDQLPVNGDRDRLKQVLINLIVNAIQYTPAGRDVLVGLGKVGQHARLIVRDKGTGIPAEDLPHIFERFYRAEKSRTRGKGGFGLGLSIAKWIVEAHGGYIEVTSKEEEGTTFCVWLPLAEAGQE